MTSIRSAVVVCAGSLWLSAAQLSPPPPGSYVGSQTCARCHQPTFDRWKNTRMANVVRDPRDHPDAIISDFAQPNPLVTFTKDQIAFVYGSKWKQRYFKKVGDDFSPLPAQWDVTHRQWRAYGVTGATSVLCDGCHSVGYDITRKTVVEWNVGCERCHGPGSEHAARPVRANIVNPARLDPIAAVDVCVQCHSEGHPREGGLGSPERGTREGGEFHWPVGFKVGLRLVDFWRLDAFTPGTTDPLHFADGTARENRMQGNDFVQSVMYTRGVTCASCHDPHGTSNNADLVKPARLVCFTCHGPASPNGPRAATVEQHTHHKPDSAGSECVACHMPKIAQMLGDVMVRSHTFKFIAPAAADRMKMPNPCTVCHQDQTSAWAADQLKRWTGFSPWRVSQ